MQRPTISIIAGIGKNRELGMKNKLLWNIPEDMQWFREKTNGHPVIMGRKTHESIGRALPGRSNIIITHDPSYSAKNCVTACTLDEAISIAKKENPQEIFVIGGASIYTQAMPYADKLYLTVVDAAFSADAFFPDYSSFATIRYERSSSCKNLNYTFYELTR